MSARDNNSPMSRRDWFSRMFAPLQGAGKVIQRQSAPQVAVIAGRSCLAYQGSACTVCSEQCPVPGAIVIEDGFPRVVADICTGCRVCHEVCPAPTNAIFIIPRRPAASHG